MTTRKITKIADGPLPHPPLSLIPLILYRALTLIFQPSLTLLTFPSLRDAMVDLGLACDGGKDSLSMAAAAAGETVMCPGNLVVSAYVGCPDITQVGLLRRLDSPLTLRPLNPKAP